MQNFFWKFSFFNIDIMYWLLLALYGNCGIFIVEVKDTKETYGDCPQSFHLASVN